MALKSTLCTTQDVRNLSEELTTQVRDNPRIVQFINRADGLIRNGLRGFYTIDSGLEITPWNGFPQVPFEHEDHNISANTGTGSLLDVTPATTAITELWTVTFTDATSFTVSGSVSGAQGSGGTGSEFTSTNSFLVIPTAAWSGTHAANDLFYIPVYKADPLILACSAYLSAGMAMKSIFQGEGPQIEGKLRWSDGMDILKKLQKPYTDEGYQLGTFSPRDISPEGLEYQIDPLGRDASKYADNERTSYNDSSPGGAFSFVWGPAW